MTGLLYKDLCNLKKYLFQLGAIVLVISFLFLNSSTGVIVLGAYVVMISLMVVLNSIAYDDMAQWDKFALTMPLSRKTLVKSKYLLGLLTVLVGEGYALILVLLSSFFFPGASLVEHVFSVAASGLCGLLMIAVMLPFLIRYGVEKARIILILVLLIPAGGFAFLVKMGLVPSENTLAVLLPVLPFALLLVTFFGYIASFFISVRIAQKKEY